MTDPGFDGLARAWSFDELLREGVALIPAHAPAWTNHNASDPGITLVELLAYFSEVLAWRALRITPDAKLAFLRLLEGGAGGASDALPGQPTALVDAAIRARVAAMAQALCVVTPLDFEHAACEIAARLAPGLGLVRARALPAVDLRRLAAGDAGVAPETVGDMSVVLVPERELDAARLERLCREVEDELATRCLMTTHVHVLGPAWLHVHVGCRVALEEGVSLERAAAAIAAALQRRFGPPAPDAPAPALRPFGGALALSEVAEVIDRAEGVDWLDRLTAQRIEARDVSEGVPARVGLRIGVVATVAVDARLGGAASIALRRFERDADGDIEAIRLRPWERVRVHLDPEALVHLGSPGATVAATGRGLA